MSRDRPEFAARRAKSASGPSCESPWRSDTRTEQPPGIGHRDARNRTTLHRLARTPGNGEFLPRFLPKDAPRRNRNAVFPVHSRQPKQPARARHQPSKLVMRVRFPSPAPLPSSFLVFSVTCPPPCSKKSGTLASTQRSRMPAAQEGLRGRRAAVRIHRPRSPSHGTQPRPARSPRTRPVSGRSAATLALRVPPKPRSPRRSRPDTCSAAPQHSWWTLRG